MSFYNKYSYFHRKTSVQSSSSTPSNASAMYNQQNQYDQHNQKNITDLPPGSILLYNITPDEFYQNIKAMVKEILQQDQLLTKEGAIKMAGISNATFMKAINNGIIKPQLVKGRTRAMYLESEVLKVEKKKKQQTGEKY
jgi:hypothetical protein